MRRRKLDPQRDENFGAHQFALVVTPGSGASGAEGWLEAKRPDAVVSSKNGFLILHFERRSRTFIGDVVTAIRDVHAAGLIIWRIEPDHLVSLSDIARRLNVSRPTVSMYRRNRSFPQPIARVSSDSPIWDWVHILRWLYCTKGISHRYVVESKILRDINFIIQNSGPPRGMLVQKLSAEFIHYDTIR